MSTTFHDLTETPGQKGSAEQLRRMFTRYHFALGYCAGRDVLEVACGAGQGLGYLARQARTVWGGDYTESLLQVAQRHYGNRIPLLRLDAHHLPVRDGSFDVILLYEALYYLNEPGEVLREFHRVLRPGGTVLITLPNRSLPDFHPSPLSIRYYTPPELKALMEPLGFRTTFYGDTPVDYSSLCNRMLAFVKATVVKMNLMPRTLKGRERLKRLIYGKLTPVPAELEGNRFSYGNPEPIEAERPDGRYRVLYAVAEVGGR